MKHRSGPPQAASAEKNLIPDQDIAGLGHTSSTTAEAAKQYATQGIKVLPCWWRDFGRDEAKAPIGKLVPNGFHDATTNLGTIEYWWRVQPRALIGGVVPDDAIALDFDPRKVVLSPEEEQAIRHFWEMAPTIIDGVTWEHGSTLTDEQVREHYLEEWLYQNIGQYWCDLLDCAAHARYGNAQPTGHGYRLTLDDTRTCISGRGDGGEHYYFKRPPGEINKKRLPQGIDIKDGGKGYLIMPPSLHPDTGQPYRWAWGDHAPIDEFPPGVWEHFTTPEPQSEFANPRTSTGTPSQGQLAGILGKVAGAINGERNSLLYWGACRLTENSYPKEAFNALHAAAVSTGLDGREVTKTIRSANHALGGAL